MKVFVYEPEQKLPNQRLTLEQFCSITVFNHIRDYVNVLALYPNVIEDMVSVMSLARSEEQVFALLPPEIQVTDPLIVSADIMIHTDTGSKRYTTDSIKAHFSKFYEEFATMTASALFVPENENK